MGLVYSFDLPPSWGNTVEWHDYEMRVHWHESDPAGIAFYGNYIFWQERAFASLLSSRGYKYESEKIGYPVIFVECRYLRPIPVWSKVKVSIAISPKSDLRRLVTPFRISLIGTEQPSAEGEIHRRFLHLDSSRMVECPEELREVFGIV